MPKLIPFTLGLLLPVALWAGPGGSFSNMADPGPAEARIECEFMLRTSWPLERAITTLHKKLTIHPHLAYFAQGTPKTFAALGLEKLDPADFPFLQLHVRENFPRNPTATGAQGDYILSFHRGTERDPVSELGFDAPPVFVWMSHGQGKASIEAHLKQLGLPYNELQPDSIEGRPLGVHPLSKNDMKLYMIYSGSTPDGSDFIEIGAYMSCRSIKSSMDLEKGLVRTADGYFCRVPILAFY